MEGDSLGTWTNLPHGMEWWWFTWALDQLTTWNGRRFARALEPANGSKKNRNPPSHFNKKIKYRKCTIMYLLFILSKTNLLFKCHFRIFFLIQCLKIILAEILIYCIIIGLNITINY
jgi:hypothetical protein